MASTKVGDGLAYQAAVRRLMGRCSCITVQERQGLRSRRIGPSGLAWCGRWRDPSTTGRWVSTGVPGERALHILEGDGSCQRSSNHSRRDLRRFHGQVSATAPACVANSPWGSRTKTRAQVARAACQSGTRPPLTRGEFHRAGSAGVPGYRHLDPCTVGKSAQEGLQRGRAERPCDQRRPTVPARLTCWRRFIKGGVQAQLPMRVTG